MSASADHLADTVEQYLLGEATTVELRAAMNHYRESQR